MRYGLSLLDSQVSSGEKKLGLNVQMDNFDGKNNSNLTEYHKCKNTTISSPSPLFGPYLLWPNGRQSQQLLSFVEVCERTDRHTGTLITVLRIRNAPTIYTGHRCIQQGSVIQVLSTIAGS